MMMLMLVSLGGHLLVIIDRNARHTRLNICLRGYGNIHSPEFLGRDRSGELEISAKRSSRIERGGVSIPLLGDHTLKILLISSARPILLALKIF